MNDASFASLSPTLLARKGGARPAMRPQHGGMLGSIGSGLGQDTSSDQGLDDLGWNDMGDEQAPQHDADAIKLTPSPMNQETAAQARLLDQQSGAKLAEISASSSPARDQQDLLAKRIERKSPPILCDAIMSNDDDLDDERYEPGFDAEYADGHVFENNPGLGAGEHGDDDEADSAGTGPEMRDAPGIGAYHAYSQNITSDKPSENFPQPRAAKAQHRPPLQRVAAADQGRRAAFTLRLDAERHLQLRLASTISGRSAQQIVTSALDAFLAGMPELAALAAQVKRPDAENSLSGDRP